MPVSEKTYRQLVLEDPDGQWELHCGLLRRKPDDMSVEHNDVESRLVRRLVLQLDEDEFVVRGNSARTRQSPEHYYIPDVCVIPVELVRGLRAQQRSRRRTVLDIYEAPLPLVVEIWSPSTGDYDVDAKLPEYQRRGDLEIWRLHPYERTLIAWRRQADGSYSESTHTSGVVQLAALPNVSIDLDSLFP